MEMHVLFDTRGTVLAVFRPSADADAPKLDLVPGRGQRTARFEVPHELKDLQLRDLHAHIAIRPHKDGPRLVVRKR